LFLICIIHGPPPVFSWQSREKQIFRVIVCLKPVHQRFENSKKGQVMNDKPLNQSSPPPPASCTERATAASDYSPATAPASALIRLKKILVPVDFSAASKQALKYAIAFAAQFKATLLLLHVVEFNLVGSEFGALDLSLIENDLNENAAKQLQTLVDHDIGSRAVVETLVRSGRPYYEIVETAKTCEADLILIATHGHSGLAHVLLGSTVERVVRHAPCPVLTVRPQEHDFV
jgi:nucleotide-binding universal stress UspA family protein